ncbi:MoaD/ThiS family protein [Mycobacterium kyorinense]|uniref:Molybdopterin synthase sulfur carrier subunit n=1 Tax=Mycobacterium kyorinense TaxID=487514 RepID=A0A1X1Y360_9MYCO|nr:MoaD/ThiS family protein [Mycobacterium kyorinense]ORW05430.1 molybdopterin synthase sulfur carrier subunit [Mycobacterium kyorinense]
MTQVPDELTGIQVMVRYFAAARAAAGTETETAALRPGATVAELVDTLGRHNERLATVLKRCSYLCDGIAVRDQDAVLQTGQTIDVLPPFAGG